MNLEEEYMKCTINMKNNKKTKKRSLIRSWIDAFIIGSKKTEDLIKGERRDSNISGIHYQIQSDAVAEALLKGELTQSVKDLRYQMYLTEMESKNKRYIGNGIVVEADDFDEKRYLEKCDPTDNNYKLFLIKNGDVKAESFNSYNFNIFNESKDNNEISIGRDFIPSFYIEDYIKKVLIRKIDNDTFLSEIYLPNDFNPFNRIDHIFNNAIVKIFSGSNEPSICDIKKIKFTSEYLKGFQEGLVEYEFDVIKFDKIVKYGCNYVVKYICKMADGYPISLMDQFKTEKIENNRHKKIPRKINLVTNI